MSEHFEILALCHMDSQKLNHQDMLQNLFQSSFMMPSQGFGENMGTGTGTGDIFHLILFLGAQIKIWGHREHAWLST